MDSLRDLLLYVDDEEQALKYFRLTFAKDHEVLTATDAAQAWDLVERHGDRLAMVISDQRMPGRSGVELLTAIKERCPRTIRLLTTAYSDLDSAISAVNRGEIYAYVTKPWKVDELRVTVRQALTLHHLMRERDALLAEKMAVFQHLLLVDRSRSLGMAVAGLSGLVRHPLAAAAAWLRDRSAAFAIAEVKDVELRDLWPAVLTQSRNLAVLAGEIGGWLAENRGSDAVSDASAVLVKAAEGVPGTQVTEKRAVSMACDRKLLAAGFVELLRLLQNTAHEAGPDTLIRISDGNGAHILSLRLSGYKDGTLIPDRAGMAAYLAFHHHGGSIAASSWTSSGRQVEIVLGSAGQDGMDDFLSLISRGER